MHPDRIVLGVASERSEAARGSDALVLPTEWEKVRTLDLARLRSLMRRPALIDGRHMLDPNAARALGFRYAGVGR